MKCEYCGNTSGKADSRGGCISCGFPLPKGVAVPPEFSVIDTLKDREVKLRVEMYRQFIRMAVGLA